MHENSTVIGMKTPCINQGCGSWKRSYFNESESAKSMPLPHHSKKRTVNSLLHIILFTFLDIILNARFAWMPDLILGHDSSLDFQIVLT